MAHITCLSHIFDVEELKNLGQVSSKYVYEQMEVHPRGLVKNPSLILKLYEMHVKDKPLKTDLEQTKRFLQNRINKGEIEPLLGLGFAILSEEMLNVARWDTEYSTVPKNQIYEYKKSDLGTAKLLDIKDVGAFCMWELGIARHEADFWEHYLQSGREEINKRDYLSNVIEGFL